MTAADRDRWNAKYALQEQQPFPIPAEWMIEQLSDRQAGRACDLACGRGQNALWLAEHGWQVDAVDISPLGWRRAEGIAIAQQWSVSWIESDLDEWCPEQAAYDLMIVFRFLDRKRLPDIVRRGLRPGGILVYETFGGGQASRPDYSLQNPEFILKPGELPRLFPFLETRVYQEVSTPAADLARFVGYRRPGSDFNLE